MGERSHYLPRTSVLENMSDHDRAMVLDVHLRALEDEISGLKSGWISPGRGGKAYQLKLSHARMRRLVATANSYGLWLDEVAA